MAEYIEREAVNNICLKHYNESFDDIPAHEALYAVINDINKIPAADVVEVVHGEWILKTHSFYVDNWDESIELCVYITANCSKCGKKHPDQYEVYHKHLYAPEDATENFRFEKESEEALTLAEFKQRDYKFAGFCPECGAKMDGERK